MKTEHEKSGKMEALLGLSRKIILPKEGMRILNEAVATRQQIHQEYRDVLEVSMNLKRYLRLI